jgi:hypothetical protein
MKQYQLLSLCGNKQALTDNGETALSIVTYCSPETEKNNEKNRKTNDRFATRIRTGYFQMRLNSADNILG